MKAIIRISILFLIIPDFSAAAFSKAEIKQLNEINKTSETQMKATYSSLKKAISTAVEDNPEKSQLIIELDTAWQAMTKKKCQLEIFESEGTDAEISQYNNCLGKYYSEEESYFNSLQP